MKSEMTVLEWRGKAYGKNEKMTFNKRGHPVKNGHYKAFQDEMKYFFMAQAERKCYLCPDIIMHCEINRERDAHNLIEPVMDALQMAGVIENDRNVGWVRLAPPDYHPRGKEDKIIIILTGETVEKER